MSGERAPPRKRLGKRDRHQLTEHGVLVRHRADLRDPRLEQATYPRNHDTAPLKRLWYRSTSPISTYWRRPILWDGNPAGRRDSSVPPTFDDNETVWHRPIQWVPIASTDLFPEPPRKISSTTEISSEPLGLTTTTTPAPISPTPVAQLPVPVYEPPGSPLQPQLGLYPGPSTPPPSPLLALPGTPPPPTWSPTVSIISPLSVTPSPLRRLHAGTTAPRRANLFDTFGELSSDDESTPGLRQNSILELFGEISSTDDELIF